MEKHIIPDYLRLSVTDHCNLNCLYCTPLGKSQFLSHNDILRYEEMVRLAKLFVKAGVKKIRVTGGEPLIKKNITGLIEMLKDIEGLEDLSLTTNGVYLKYSAVSLKKCGLDRVNISLDTLRKERFKKITGADCFENVWEGIFTALKAGLYPVKLNVIIMRGINDDEITEFASLTLNYDIIVRFIELFPTNRRLKTLESCFISNEETKIIIEGRFSSLSAVNGINGNGPAEYYRLPDSKGTIGFISSYTKNFCNDCSRLRLDCIGRVSPCLFSGHTCDLKPLIRGNKSDEEILKNIENIFLQKKKYRKDFNNCKVEMSSIGG